MIDKLDKNRRMSGDAEIEKRPEGSKTQSHGDLEKVKLLRYYLYFDEL